jgi:hypothetical protein
MTLAKKTTQVSIRTWPVFVTLTEESLLTPDTHISWVIRFPARIMPEYVNDCVERLLSPCLMSRIKNKNIGNDKKCWVQWQPSTISHSSEKLHLLYRTPLLSSKVQTSDMLAPAAFREHRWATTRQQVWIPQSNIVQGLPRTFSKSDLVGIELSRSRQ